LVIYLPFVDKFNDPKLFHNYSIIPFLFQSKKLFQNTPKRNVNYSIWKP
jgi:hypothetical protein